MAKFFGAIGYAETKETTPGVWEEQIAERTYYGDLIRNTRRLQTSDKLNDDINITNEISIVADPFAYQHCSEIIYVEYMGSKWKVSDVEPIFPRLRLTIGGVYNGQSPGTSE